MNGQLENRTREILAETNSRQQKLAFESRQWKSGWMRSVDAARIVWNRLSLEELLQTAGEPLKLSGLVEKRYALGQAEARRQVQEFLSQCGTWS